MACQYGTLRIGEALVSHASKKGLLVAEGERDVEHLKEFGFYARIELGCHYGLHNYWSAP